VREQGLLRLQEALASIESALQGRNWLVGDDFSIADAYLGVFAGWVKALGARFAGFSALHDFGQRYERRPSVQRARAREAVATSPQ